MAAMTDSSTRDCAGQHFWFAESRRSPLATRMTGSGILHILACRKGLAAQLVLRQRFDRRRKLKRALDVWIHRLPNRWLACVALHPTIGGSRIPPEELFGDGWAFGDEIVAGNAEHLLVRSPLIAVRPVAAVHQAVLAENIPELIESGAIEIRIGRDPAVDAAENLRHLDVGLRALAQFPKTGVLSGAVLRIG